MNTYLQSSVKGVKYVLLTMLGLLIAGFIANMPEYANMTVAAVLVALYDVLKHKLGVKLP